MNLFDALHNFVDQLLNRTSAAHEAADILHDALVATGHETAAAALTKAVAEADAVAPLAQVVVSAAEAVVAPSPAPVSSPVEGAGTVSPPGA